MFGTKFLLAAAAVVACASHAAEAQPIGTVKIKGTRYVNGEATTVRCAATAANTIDWSLPAQRALSIDPSCELAQDATTLIFAGRENVEYEHGVLRKRILFTGIIGARNDPIASHIRGGLTGEVTLRSDGSFEQDRGTIQYHLINGVGQNVQFVGTYTAHCSLDFGSCGGM